MDQYEMSVQSVDAALKRLNATLASYHIAASSADRGITQYATERDINGVGHETKSLQHAGPANASSTDGQRHADDDPSESVWKDALSIRSTQPILEVSQDQLQLYSSSVSSIFAHIVGRPYCLPLYVLLSQRFLALGYPDLAAGAVYKALLLSDAVQDSADEYHEYACDELHEVIQHLPLVERISLLKTELHADDDPCGDGGDVDEDEGQADIEVSVWLREHYLLLVYRLLSRSTFLCGSYRSAAAFVAKALDLYPNDDHLQTIRKDLDRAVADHFGIKPDSIAASEYGHPSTWPDKGHVRRELYPWNDLEPDRLNEIATLNGLMAEVAPKLKVRGVELPALMGAKGEVVTQLGVFAKEDISPGDVVLNETSMLTANNKLQDALCDACSADLPDLTGDGADIVTSCPECEVVFCSEDCFERAMESYHPALCGMDVEAIAKDVPPAEAADSLYALLLLRALAMAERQECHPLQLNEVKYIWGDFHTLPLADHWRPPSFTSPAGSSAGLPQTLPFSFEHNIRLPFHMLEKMDIDIFANPQYDVWVFNTLYAKFRGTASARLSGLGGRAIRGPEVSAVHPMWCLANHSCDPNVSWEWGGSIKFWARDGRVAWVGKSGEEVRSRAGIKKDEEVLNHYCDVDLPVKERREWARGALGGDCMCARCVWEAGQESV